MAKANSYWKVLTVLLVAALVFACCEKESGGSSEGQGEALRKMGEVYRADPAPGAAFEEPVDGQGAFEQTRNGVSIAIPSRAFGDESVVVQLGEEIGESGDETFGTPVGIKHSGDGPTEPVTLTWDVAHLNEEQRAALVVSRWDPDLKVWRAGDTHQVTWSIDGDELVAEVGEFSFWNFSTITSQSVGELIGARSEAPECTNDPMHQWVRQLVDPDEDFEASAVLVCFEPAADDAVAVRIVNNRTFTQVLESDAAVAEWAWTSGGEITLDPSQVIYAIARDMYDNGHRHLMPPLTETAVGIARPIGGGDHLIQATSGVEPFTVLTDILVWAFSNVSPGGFGNPLVDAFVQAIYECGGGELLKSLPRSISEALPAGLSILQSCTSAVMDNTTEFGELFERQVQKAIRAADPDDAARIVAGHRWLRQLAGAIKVLEVGKIAFYWSDLAANDVVGDLTVAVRGFGVAEPLGRWTPSCRDIEADSNSLWKHLFLREPFRDTSRDYSDFPELPDAADAAVRPLRENCTTEYLGRLADLLPGDWADSSAGEIVAEILVPHASSPSPSPSRNPDADFYDETGFGPACADIGCSLAETIEVDHPVFGKGEVNVVNRLWEELVGFYFMKDGDWDQIRWGFDTFDFEWLVFDVGVDATGTIFVVLGDGGPVLRTAALVPSEKGYTVFGFEGEDPTRFPSRGETFGDRDGDGDYEIITQTSNCDPTCPDGVWTEKVFEWNGSDFVDPDGPEVISAPDL